MEPISISIVGACSVALGLGLGAALRTLYLCSHPEAFRREVSEDDGRVTVLCECGEVIEERAAPTKAIRDAFLDTYESSLSERYQFYESAPRPRRWEAPAVADVDRAIGTSAAGGVVWVDSPTTAASIPEWTIKVENGSPQ